MNPHVDVYRNYIKFDNSRNKDKNILNAIYSRKADIRKMCYLKIGNEPLFRPGMIKPPSALTRLKKGLIARWFNKNGLVTSQVKNLQKYYKEKDIENRRSKSITIKKSILRHTPTKLKIPKLSFINRLYSNEHSNYNNFYLTQSSAGCDHISTNNFTQSSGGKKRKRNRHIINQTTPNQNYMPTN